MSENKNTEIAVIEETTIQEVESATLVKFTKPYTFEGKTYTGIDLAGLEDLTAKDMIEAEKYLQRSGAVTVTPEMTMEYVTFIASRVSGQPLEFFIALSSKDAIRVKNKVTGFFYGVG